MKIRETTRTDIGEILQVHRGAFGEAEGPVIADLVEEMLADETAAPVLSLAATEIDGAVVGHVLFTKAQLEGTDEKVSTRILAPLAVAPGAQSQGVGSRLVEEGLRRLGEAGVDLVFVLGHPDYYPRFGFQPAGVLGYEAPYLILEKNAGAWMVRELRPGVIGRVSGKVQCCDVLNRPEHWRE